MATVKTGDSLEISGSRETNPGVGSGEELDVASALAAVDFARQSIEGNPAAAISVQANARPENVLDLISESVLSS